MAKMKYICKFCKEKVKSSKTIATIKFQSNLVEVTQRHTRVYYQTFADFSQFLRLFLRHCPIKYKHQYNSWQVWPDKILNFQSLILYWILNFSSYYVIKLAFTSRTSGFQNSIQSHCMLFVQISLYIQM